MTIRDTLAAKLGRVRSSFDSHWSHVQTARIVSARYGKPILAQLRELVELRRGWGRLSRFDYYAYALFDDSLYTPERKQEYISWDWTELRDALNQRDWTVLCDDKVISYTLFRTMGWPHPAVYCVFQPGSRNCGTIPVLNTPESMGAFLRDEMRYPCFGKPAQGWEGEGASSIDDIDRERDMLLLAGGDEISVDDYVQSVPVIHCWGRKRRASEPAGYLFQERIRQHEEIERLTGGRITTIRVILLLWPDGPRVHRAVWKIPVGHSIVDNNRGGSAGNIRCGVDVTSGEVQTAVQSTPPERRSHWALGAYGTPVEHHPDTGSGLIGYRLPHWERAMALCRDAAAAIPGIRYQSWDIAIGQDGPLLLEVNHHGGVRVAQVPGHRGLCDEDFRTLWSLHQARAEQRAQRNRL